MESFPVCKVPLFILGPFLPPIGHIKYPVPCIGNSIALNWLTLDRTGMEGKMEMLRPPFILYHSVW